MKIFGLFFVASALILSFATIGLAEGKQGEGHKTVGEVIKVEGEFIMVKTKEGKTHKFHVNKSTHLKGDVKSGSKVEVLSTDSGHAISMSVVQ